MIDRFLRRLTVSRRVLGGFLTLALLLAISIPVIALDHSLLIGRLTQATRVEAQANRALLRAAVGIESSRVNLSRYIQDYLPSSASAQDAAIDTTQSLAEAQEYLASPEQKQAVTSVINTVEEYRAQVRSLEVARRKGDQQEAARLLFQAYKTGADAGQGIEQIVRTNEESIKEANEAAFAEAGQRLAFLLVGFVVLLALALTLGMTVSRSITRPVSELRSGAEAFSQGRWDTTLPIAGTDELSTLARTFNEMSTQLGRSYQDLERHVAERTAELERRTSYLEASAKVSQAASSILETDELMRQVADLIRDRFGLYYVGLFQLDEAGQWAVLKAGTGAAGRAMLARGHRLHIGIDSMIGWCIINAKGRVASEAGSDAVRRGMLELPETRSEAALPLRSRGKVVGALTVQSTQPGAFDEAALAALQMMADQVAVALDNARLFSESQTALEMAHRAYGELSSQEWAQITRSQPTGYLRNVQGIFRAEGPWRPEMVQATRTGQAIQDQGVSVAVPIKVRDQVLGAIRLRKPEGAAEWTPEETALLETLTEQLGVALESARLYQDTQRRATHEKLVGEITSRMREALDEDTVLQTALREIGDALNIPQVEVRMLGATGHKLSAAASGARE
jgi:GAF domain-containing protein/HAMP domain-containing protein